MAYDLIPDRFLSFPQIKLPSIWNDDDDWTTASSRPSGLSISEDDKQIFIEAALPGIDPKNIEVTYQDEYLWIHGTVKEEEKHTDRKYFREATKSFSYRVAIPGEINTTIEPTATYKNGIMIVAFQKSPKSQPKRIQVTLGNQKTQLNK